MNDETTTHVVNRHQSNWSINIYIFSVSKSKITPIYMLLKSKFISGTHSNDEEDYRRILTIARLSALSVNNEYWNPYSKSLKINRIINAHA